MHSRTILNLKIIIYTAYPSLSVRSEMERMDEGKPVYNLTFLPESNRPYVEKKTTHLSQCYLFKKLRTIA